MPAEARPVDAPLVSVCIPTYRRAERLRRAIERVLECSYPNLEILVSDNASPDHTQQVCEELASRHPQLRYLRQAVNQGATRNFELVRAQARGKYFLWHADDDYLDPDYIARCVAELEADPSLALAAGRGAYHPGDHAVAFRGNVINACSRHGFLRALHYMFLVEDNAIFYGVYRRELVQDCRLPNDLGGDAIFVAEVLLRGGGRTLTDVHIWRETSDNTSKSAAAIVAALGAPRWEGAFPWFAVPLNLARGIDFGASSLGYGRALVPLLRATTFLVSFSKQAIQVVMRRIPYGRQLYNRLFASQAGI